MALPSKRHRLQSFLTWLSKVMYSIPYYDNIYIINQYRFSYNFTGTAGTASHIDNHIKTPWPTRSHFQVHSDRKQYHLPWPPLALARIHLFLVNFLLNQLLLLHQSLKRLPIYCRCQSLPKLQALGGGARHQLLPIEWEAYWLAYNKLSQWSW